MAKAVHVGVGRGWRVAELEQPVLEADLVHERERHVISDHDEVADVFILHRGLDEEREHAEEEIVRQRQDVKTLEVEAKLVVVVAFEGLERDADDDHAREQQHRDQAEANQLGDIGDPRLGGQRVGDLRQVQVALAPDDLA
jgi:hypothetical protein